jgi:hypothetical protein
MQETCDIAGAHVESGFNFPFQMMCECRFAWYAAITVTYDWVMHITFFLACFAIIERYDSSTAYFLIPHYAQGNHHKAKEIAVALPSSIDEEQSGTVKTESGPVGVSEGAAGANCSGNATVGPSPQLVGESHTKSSREAALAVVLPSEDRSGDSAAPQEGARLPVHPAVIRGTADEKQGAERDGQVGVVYGMNDGSGPRHARGNGWNLGEGDEENAGWELRGAGLPFLELRTSAHEYSQAWAVRGVAVKKGQNVGESDVGDGESMGLPLPLVPLRESSTDARPASPRWVSFLLHCYAAGM